MKTKRTSRHGFTMIEIIAAVVLGALAMLAILPLFDRVFLLSHEPRIQLREGLDLQAAMEGIVAWHTNGLSRLHSHVGAEGTMYDGRFTVVNNHYVRFDGVGGGVESADPANTNLLKVTIQNALGEQLTRLFTEPL